MSNTLLARSARGLAACAAGLALCLPSSGQTAFNKTSPVGINLAPHNYYTSEWVFVDLFKYAAPWWPQSTATSTWDTGDTLDIGPNGWIRSLKPQQAAGTLIFRNVGGRYPGGRYVVTYDGDGDLEFRFDARVVSKSPGRMEIDVTPSDNGIYVRVVRTNPNDYIRNIRIVQPQFASRKSAFHPRFLDNWKTASVVRFMDWQRTNNSTVRTWSQRTRPTWYSQDSVAGVALEYMIDLCNELQAEPWVCIPHLADDNYVQQFATMVRDRLDPKLRVWVEYSNEAWNGQFAQAQYMQQMGLSLGLDPSPTLAGAYYFSQRTVEIHDIFARVLGGTNRLVRVMASQNANPWLSGKILDWHDDYKKVDVLAVAPYFGGYLGKPSTQAQVAGYSVPTALLNAFYEIAPVMNDVRGNVKVARDRGLQLVAYEGGQHMVGTGGAENNTQLTQLFHDCNRHPWMGLLIQYFLDEWKRAGGQTFVAFNSCSVYSKWGSWGFLEFSDQDVFTSPKYFGLQAFIYWNPRWW